MQITSIGEILFDIFDKDEKLGGAPFNFIYHIIKLTGEGNFISRIGDDRLGNAVLDFFKLKKISAGCLQIDKIHPTGLAGPELNSKKNPVWHIEKNAAYDFIELTGDIEKVINEKTNCIYFGTLAQREEISRKTIQSLLNRKTKYFCDLNFRQNFFSKEIIESSLKAADVVKLNLDELAIVRELFFGYDKTSFEQNEIAEVLIKKYNIELLCITMGEEGAVLYKAKDFFHYKLYVNHSDIVDTVGAGDAYAAILCIGYLKNWDIRKTNKIASEFASEIIKIRGALPAEDSIYSDFRSRIFQ